MFSSFKKRKELIDRELEIYRKEELVKIKLEVAENKLLANIQLEEAKTEVALIEAGKSPMLIEIANLKETNRCYISEHNAVKSAKDKTIEILESTIKELIQKIPKELSQTTINNK